ncbi:hypothetical protein HPB51_027571 [Rhipicephalus microplus]|uniref:Uncharacterized protein n=1 Tax=Rhipicephalus microplus TaxID=6941 RepID=A0A9J6D013_RHIMP|nr:hypothetical protein HPB51_027571 [Rhipicephalus microplus]
MGAQKRPQVDPKQAWEWEEYTSANHLASTPALPKANSQSRWTYSREVWPEHILYTTMKVMRHNVSEKTITLRTNPVTSFLMWLQIYSVGREFLDNVLKRDQPFVRGVLNAVQYWQDRRKELFAIIHQSGNVHMFFTFPAAKWHWDKHLETLKRLRVSPEVVA